MQTLILALFFISMALYVLGLWFMRDEVTSFGVGLFVAELGMGLFSLDGVISVVYLTWSLLT